MAEPKPRPKGLESPITQKVMKYAGRAHVWVYRVTKGRIGAKFRVGSARRNPAPTLLLDHVGKKSGRTYTTPLLYLLDGPNVVVVASTGGMAKDPQWYRNLMAHPDTKVQIAARSAPCWPAPPRPRSAPHSGPGWSRCTPTTTTTSPGRTGRSRW